MNENDFLADEDLETASLVLSDDDHNEVLRKIQLLCDIIYSIESELVRPADECDLGLVSSYLEDIFEELSELGGLLDIEVKEVK